MLVLSEYGISPVTRPVHLNRVFREKGWLQIKDELGRETLDCGASRVFAIADHQVAHVYVNDPALRDEVRALLENTPGVDEVRAAAEIWGAGVATERGGDFIAIAAADAWFTYYFWENDAVAPDYARTIDIHRKPGYDPCELFIDPAIAFPKLRIAKFLLKKKLGFRGLAGRDSAGCLAGERLARPGPGAGGRAPGSARHAIPGDVRGGRSPGDSGRVQRGTMTTACSS